MRPGRPWGAIAVIVTLAGCGGNRSGGEPTRLTVVRPAPPLMRIAGRAVGPRTGAIKWERRLEGPVVPGPIEGVDGSLLAASNGGILHALDPATGKDRWTFNGEGSYGVDLSTSPARLRDGTVIWPGPRSTVFALDGRTGASKWTASVPGGDPHTPAIDGDRIYVQDGGGALTAFDTAGRWRWEVKLGDSSHSSPAVGTDGTVYTAADKTLFAVRDGQVVWRVRTDALIEVSPAVASEGTITVASNDHFLYGVSPAGRVRWRFDIGAWTYSSPAVTPDGLIYFGDHLGRLNGIDARTGRLRYRVLGRGKTRTVRAVGVWTRPAVDANHAVYFGTRLGNVHGFDARARRLFDLHLGAETIDSYPTLTRDGLLVIGSESGRLTAIGP